MGQIYKEDSSGSKSLRPRVLSGLFNIFCCFCGVFFVLKPLPTNTADNEQHSYYFMCVFITWLDIHLDSFFTCTCTFCSTPVVCLTATVENVFVLSFTSFILMQFIYSIVYLKFRLLI